jgi:hypothetical protein
MLAMYRPGGGEFLFDTAAMRQRLIETMEHIRRPNRREEPKAR